MSEQKKPTFFEKLHTERYTWHDFFLVPVVIVILFLFLEQILGEVLMIPLKAILDTNDSFIQIFLHYFSTIGCWIVYLVYISVSKFNRPILSALSPKAKGNTWKLLLLGLVVGFAQNALCIFSAILHGDIFLSYDKFEFFKLLLLLFAVFVQSSSEELICRGFLYQRLRRGYRNPWIAIIGNSVIFAALHIFNPGLTFLSIANIIIVAIFYSLVVYYFDSIWFTMAAHAAWNFTQNILFGLPNSGIVSSYSYMNLDASTARNSFFYDVKFGVEGTVLACLLLLVCCVLTWWMGKKYNRPSLDVWAEAELKKA